MPLPSTGVPGRVLLRDQVENHIRRAILDGTLRPGERLQDDELSSWLAVSRTPIREALASLAREGLVEMVPNRYTRVVCPTTDEANHAVRALGILLNGVVRITLPTMTDDQRRRTVERIDARIAELATGGTRAVIRSVHEGYEAWLEHCPNPALADVVRRAAGGLAFAYRVDTADQLVPAGPLVVRLRAYRDAVADNDADAAARAFELAHTPADVPADAAR